MNLKLASLVSPCETGLYEEATPCTPCVNPDERLLGGTVLQKHRQTWLFARPLAKIEAQGHDEDCDPLTFGFKDSDSDGHPDANCLNISGSVQSSGDDCDDTRAGVHWGVPELCNGLDDDCDGLIDMADDRSLGISVWTDRDHDGFGNPALFEQRCPSGDLRGFAINDYDCNDSRADRRPGAGCP